MEGLPEGVKLTPMLEQYLHWKRQYPGYLLFFRMGDFFELFFDDAVEASELLDLTLTARDAEKAIPMAGVPHHAVDGYLARLVEAGRRVALCDQVTEPDGKTLVERRVVRLVTPGTFVPPESGQEGLLAACIPGKPCWALALLSMSTGRFEAGNLPEQEARSYLLSFSPQETLVPRGLEGFSLEGPLVERERDLFSVTAAEALLKHRHGVLSLEGFGFEPRDAALGAAGAVLRYVEETQFGRTGHLQTLRRIQPRSGLLLDPSSQCNLELVEGRGGSLYGILNRCKTPLGRRLLREWILHPLNDPEAIELRQEAVQALLDTPSLRESLRRVLEGLPDVERALSRLHLNTGGPRDLGACRDFLSRLPRLESFRDRPPLLPWLPEPCPGREELGESLSRALEETLPRNLREGGVIRPGHDGELDSLRQCLGDAKGWLRSYEEGERARTGIRNLKVGFNRVFGHYIEVGKTAADRVPGEYQRRQTLVNCERYVTEELRTFEDRRCGAEGALAEREERLWNDLLTRTLSRTADLQAAARKVAELDVLHGFAEVAAARGYCRPLVDEGETLSIRGGRHPVVEAALTPEPFTPNDLELDGNQRRMILLTGPNMAGKSTFLRMGALLVLMAQMGSFVPAEEARIGRIDRLFTRIGARDDLNRGKSTFMVEMMETAQILNGLGPRSLVILDEIGRGTSTDDGMSIAWAVMEFLQEETELRPKVLFATHYHELTGLAEKLPGVRNCSVAVEETPRGLAFLHHVVPRPASRSYGVDVARLAGLPESVLLRSRELLSRFEARRREGTELLPQEERPRSGETGQRRLFDVDLEALLEELSLCDPDRMTPLQGLETLYRLREKGRMIWGRDKA